MAAIDILWLTAFIDRPAGATDDAAAFWAAVAGAELSAWRGDEDEYATLIPPDGDAFLRLQRLGDGPGGTHLDVHVGDVGAAVEAAVSLGASLDAAHDGWAVLRSPGGMAWCAVPSNGEAARPAPVPLDGPEGPVHLVDQVCIDAPRSRFDDEVAFWAALTGFERVPTDDDTYLRLRRPASLPLMLLLQRRDDDDGPTRAHLDLSSTDRDAATAAHERLGATVQATFDRWTLLTDPAGVPYCITARRPGEPRPAGAA